MPHPHNTKPDVIVIGGGIIGTLTAWRLREAGQQVCLIEADLAGLCCSTGNAGSISAGSVAPLGMPGIWKQVPGMLLDADGPLSIRADYALPITPWLIRFLRSSTPAQVARTATALHALNAIAMAEYRDLARQLGSPDIFRATGQLQVYRSAEAVLKDAAGWRLRREHGVEVRDVDAGELHDLEPDVGPQFTRGVFLPDEGMIAHPERLLRTLRAQFAAAGGEIVEARAESVDPVDEATVAVRTTQGVRQAGKAVIAAGAWSRRLARSLGDRVPLEPQRGYHVVLRDAGIALQRPVVAAEAKIFVTPMEMGLRAAGTVEFGRLDSAPNPRRAQALMRNTQTLFPALKTGAPEDRSEWMGNRPCLPDSLPVIDHAHRSRRILYAFGHGHLGLTQAPATARIITDLVLDRSPACDLAPYGARRF
ncbi:NAD(P)/FAD-dependent oxidoreductase [Castellaniella sp.]|uniref:NAD(P)/FAD-dependent oxidoreductase n=1 Tax=Castellaniella sp. TaxID=1955812 RepID=UPI003C758114